MFLQLWVIAYNAMPLGWAASLLRLGALMGPSPIFGESG